MSTTTVINPPMGFDSTGETVKVTVYLSGIEGDPTVIVLGVTQALDVMRQLANQVSQASLSALRSMGVGPCETCRNARLVSTTKHGHDVADRCPSCGPRLNEWRDHLVGSTVDINHVNHAANGLP